MRYKCRRHISTDNGQTLGPILKLAANGTIGTGAAAEAGG